MTKKQNERNGAIDLFRLICSILIVVIHTSPWKNSTFGFVLREYLSRIAVPFFLVVAGYFFFKDGQISGIRLGRFVKKNLCRYALWSIPYFLIDFWIMHDEGISAATLMVRWAEMFFIRGSYYHFWFFPALIYAGVIHSLLIKIGGVRAVSVVSILMLMMGCLGTSYSMWGMDIAFIQVIKSSYASVPVQRILWTGVPYLGLGMLLSCAKTEDKRKLASLCAVFSVLYIAEKVILKRCGADDFVLTIMLWPLTGCITLWLLRTEHKKIGRFGRLALPMANLIYYVHPAFILVVTELYGAVMGAALSNEALFFTTSVTLVITGLIISRNRFGRKVLCG